MQQNLPAGVHSVTLPDESNLLLWHVLLVPVCFLVLYHLILSSSSIVYLYIMSLHGQCSTTMRVYCDFLDGGAV